jgi:outer membrane protein OmpA-like peptidoglycan-associated protein
MKAHSTAKPEHSRHHGSSDRGGHGHGQQATAVVDSRPEMEQQQGLLSLMAGSPRLQRTCACGAPSAAGGSCTGCEAKANGAGSQVLQKKLAIGSTDDPLEQEADRVADQVMAAPAHSIVGGTPPRIQHFTGQTDGQADIAAPTSVDHVLSSPGRPLDPALQQDMGQRFGRDFSRVRVHTDAAAARSARDVNSNAYTVGHNVVFGAGQFEPGSVVGKRLLAHELVHTVQQNASQQINRIQRQADITQFPGGLPCIPTTDPGHPSGLDFLFNLSASTLTPTDQSAIASFASSWISGGAKDEIFVDGYASTDGPQPLNWRLSCERAEIIKSKLLANGVPSAKILTMAHGESTEFSTTSLSPNRRAILSSIHVPEPVKPEVKPKCGPDVTKWFVDQVNLAMRDPAVLSIQSDLSTAKILLSLVPVSVSDIAEGSATAAITKEQLSLGSSAPALNPTISSQLSLGTASASRVASSLNAAVISAGIFVASAAFKWKALVNHGARYDFKAHVMDHPHTAHCPDEGCVSVETGVVTICPGAASENCYESDLTGNLFYALIGNFVGFSELTLQLGSQLAELTDRRVTPAHPAVTWDSREDTKAILLGFGFPLPLTAGALCRVLPPVRSTLSHKAGCEDCTEPTTAPLK